MGQISVSVQGAQEWQRLAKKLRGPANRELRAALRKRIQEAGKPILEDVKAAARGIPVTGEGGHGGGTARRRTYNSVQAARRAHAAGRDIRKAAARAGRRQAGLRATIAGATKLQVTAKGIRYVVNSSALPQSQRTLPRHLDSEKGWMHPLFGNRKKWYPERGRPWFASTIQKKAPEFRRSILTAIDDTIKQIED